MARLRDNSGFKGLLPPREREMLTQLLGKIKQNMEKAQKFVHSLKRRK